MFASLRWVCDRARRLVRGTLLDDHCASPGTGPGPGPGPRPLKPRLYKWWLGRWMDYHGFRIKHRWRWYPSWSILLHWRGSILRGLYWRRLIFHTYLRALSWLWRYIDIDILRLRASTAVCMLPGMYDGRYILLMTWSHV